MNTAILTFTANSLEEILSKGGDWEWCIAPNRVKNSVKYLVCCSSVGVNQHSGFLVGKINGVEFTKIDEKGNPRYLIRISEWAEINVPKLWPGYQNPVHYTNLEKWGIDPDDLKFEKVSKVSSTATQSLTIAQAKDALAKQYGVTQDNIEIIIKG